MKKIVLFLSILSFSFASYAESIGTKMEALIVDNLVKIHSKSEARLDGPIASIHSMASLGFKVTDISFSKINNNECSIDVLMKRGSEIEKYNYVLLTEAGYSRFAKKSYTSLGQEYLETVKFCLEYSK